MTTRGLEIVRFRKRYYIRYHRLDGYPECLGAKIVTAIPADPKEYQKWLESMRAEYAAKETALERHVYTIRDGVEPDYSQFHEFRTLPSEIPRLANHIEYFNVVYCYIINLDEEVFTMDNGIHWKLGNIPRQDHLWLRAIVDSTNPERSTISLDMCPEEHISSPGLELPKRNPKLNYNARLVKPRKGLADARKAFLTFTMATTLMQSRDDIIRFGMEWSPESLPFRELAFALVSIASSHATYHSFPSQRCDPRRCEMSDCKRNHLPKSPGWVGQEWAGDSAPLLEFGSPCHRPGEPPGASPTETMYWVEGVLVSLALVVDWGDITKAVTWGIKQGRTNFQLVVLSLFKAKFAEVSIGDDEKPFVKVTRSVYLSPLRSKYCLSTHPRMRPELKPGMKMKRAHGELLMNTNCTGTRHRLEHLFPGLAALTNFFEVAGNRRASSNSAGILPPELYDLILDFVDYDTWKTCLLVSTVFRARCLRKYRIDERTRIVGGPFVRLQVQHEERLLSFNFEDMQTGEILPVMHDLRIITTKKYNWMPVIGRDRKALMVDNLIQFMPAGDVPAEADSDEEGIKNLCLRL